MFSRLMFVDGNLKLFYIWLKVFHEVSVHEINFPTSTTYMENVTEPDNKFKSGIVRFQYQVVNQDGGCADSPPST